MEFLNFTVPFKLEQLNTSNKSFIFSQDSEVPTAEVGKSPQATRVYITTAPVWLKT